MEDFLENMTEEKALLILERTRYLEDSDCEPPDDSSSETDQELPVCHLRQGRETGDSRPTDLHVETHPAVPRVEAYPSTSGAGSENQTPFSDITERSGSTIKEKTGSKSPELPVCHLKQERETGDTCPTDPPFEALPAAPSVEAYPSTSGASSENQAPERSGSTMKEEPEFESLVNIPHVPMNQADFMVKEESVDSNESWLDKMKQEPISPLAMNTQKEEPDEDDDHDLYVKVSLKQRKEGIEEGSVGVTSLTQSQVESFKENSHHSLIECSTWNCSSQTAFSFAQSPSSEITDINSPKYLTRSSSSEHESVVLPNLESRKPFVVASCFTVYDTLNEEEVADTNFLKGHFGHTAVDTQEQHPYPSEGRSSATHQETPFQRAMLQSGSLRSTTGKKCFTCSHCGKTFKGKQLLIVHMRIHTGERPYKCSQCGKSFTCSSNLTVHMRKHTGERPYKCSQCGESFTRSSNLTVHMRKHTGKRPYKCSQCGKSFKESGSLTVHMRYHSGVRPYKCSQCGESFTQSSNLTVHMRKHTEKRPYKCSQCGNSFKESGSLTVHMRKHSGERPHKCSHCGESFTCSSHLTVHMRKHTGERPYKCSQCEKSFTQSCHLTRHMRKHSGERPYICSLCEKSFTQSSDLTRHMRKHSGERPYVCSLCEKSFTRSSDLTRHMRKHTGEWP